MLIALVGILGTVLIGLFVAAPFLEGARTESIENILHTVMPELQMTVTSVSLFEVSIVDISYPVGHGNVVGAASMTATQSFLDLIRFLGGRFTLEDLTITDLYWSHRNETLSHPRLSVTKKTPRYAPCLPTLPDLHVKNFIANGILMDTADLHFAGRAAVRGGRAELDGMLSALHVPSGGGASVVGSYTVADCEHRTRLRLAEGRYSDWDLGWARDSVLTCAGSSTAGPIAVRCGMTSAAGGQLGEAILSFSDTWVAELEATVNVDVIASRWKLYAHSGANEQHACLGLESSGSGIMWHAESALGGGSFCVADLSTGKCACQSALPFSYGRVDDANGTTSFSGADGTNVLAVALSSTAFRLGLTRSLTHAELTVPDFAAGTALLVADADPGAQIEARASLDGGFRFLSSLRGELTRLLTGTPLVPPVGINVHDGVLGVNYTDRLALTWSDSLTTIATTETGNPDVSLHDVYLEVLGMDRPLRATASSAFVAGMTLRDVVVTGTATSKTRNIGLSDVSLQFMVSALTDIFGETKNLDLDVRLR